LEENNTSWDEPDLEETVNNEEDETVSSPLMEEYQIWSGALQNTIKALGKKRNSLQSEYDKAQGVEDTVARAQLLVSNLYLFTPGVKTATVQDWENDCVDVELTLNLKYDSANAEADALFAQARKLKRASQIVKELLEETADAWDLLQEAQIDLESACVENEVEQGRLALVQDRLERSSRTTNFQIPSPSEQGSKSRTKSNRQPSKPNIGSPQSNIRKLMSPGGCIVLVGRNRRGNENLSLSIARGNDIWMHSRGSPGKSLSIDCDN
jgi:predicted ribosome quality control (RQC) complex YloA/Tae2 family protein